MCNCCSCPVSIFSLGNEAWRQRCFGGKGERSSYPVGALGPVNVNGWKVCTSLLRNYMYSGKIACLSSSALFLTWQNCQLKLNLTRIKLE